MNLQFFDSYPYRTLEPDLQSLMLGTRRVDAAVAFVTRPGVALLRQYLKTHAARQRSAGSQCPLPDHRGLQQRKGVSRLAKLEGWFSWPGQRRMAQSGKNTEETRGSSRALTGRHDAHTILRVLRERNNAADEC